MTEEEDDALRARLNRLGDQLKSVRPPPPANSPLSSATGRVGAYDLAMKAGGEFVAAVIIGTAIGWGLDWALHTKPAFLIVFFLVGVVAGVWNMIRATMPKSAD